MQRLHWAMLTLARGLAILGGLVLGALILMVCVSILGRALIGVGFGPVPGDFELVEAGMAFAIFAFLPICQITGAHASVDIFTNRLPPVLLRGLRALIEVGFALVLCLIAWRLFEGMESKVRSGQTTFLIQFPVWWAYAASLLGAGAAALVAVYTAAMRCLEAVSGRIILEQDP